MDRLAKRCTLEADVTTPGNCPQYAQFCETRCGGGGVTAEFQLCAASLLWTTQEAYFQPRTSGGVLSLTAEGCLGYW